MMGLFDRIKEAVVEDDEYEQERGTSAREEEIVEMLERRDGGPIVQTTFAEVMDVSQPTISRDMKLLEEQGVVERVQMGRRKLVYIKGYGPNESEW